jgi:putative flippase GtrA
VTMASHIDHLLERMDRRPLLGRMARFYQRRREQILYLVVGGWNTLFGYLIWALFQYLLHDYIYYLFILVIAWVPAVLNAYLCYRYFVFRSRGSVWRELPRFSLVYVVTLCISLVGLPILLRVLPFSIYVTQALFMAVMVVLSYLSHKYFSFKGGHRRPIPPIGEDQVPEAHAADVPSQERTV